MTGGKSTRERVGAVFFAFVMVTSMVAVGGAAFAGTASAAATGGSSISLSTNDVVEGEGVTATLSDDGSNGNDIHAIVDVNGNGNYDAATDRVITTSTDTAANDNDVTIDTTNLDGSYEVYVFQDDTDDNPPDDGTDISGQSSASLSVTPLEVDISPSDATYGDTVSLNVDITAGGSAYQNNVYVAVTGLNNDDTNGENKVLKRGSTTSGSFSTSITLSGVDASGNLMGNYAVSVRNADQGSNFPSVGSNAPGAASKDPTGNDLDATALLDASPDVSVSSVSNTERGSSASISGSVIDFEGSGISDYTVDVRNLNDDSSLGTTTTAGNGDFATTETLNDAAEHGVALSLFNGSIVTNGDGAENVAFERFNASANDASASSDVSSFPARISETGTIDLTAEGADDSQNITRFRLSGVELEKLDLSAGGTADRVEKVTFTDGSSLGSTSDAAAAIADPGQNTDTDGENELTSASDAQLLETTSNANIESVVIVADAATTDASTGSAVNTVDFTAIAGTSGTLTAEAQVEDVTTPPDAANTPANFDYVDSTSITVEEPQDLNVNLNPTSDQIDDGDGGGADGTADGENLQITVLDSDGNGLIDSAGTDDIGEVTVEISGNGTQFEADQGGNGQVILNPGGTPDAEDADVTFSQGQNKDSISFTASEIDGNDDVSNDITTYEVPSVIGEENGTLDVTVTADVVGQSQDITGSASYTFTDSDSVSGLPSGQFTVGEEFDLNATVTNGDGTVQNSREVTLSSDTADTFQVDTDDDGSYEVTGIENIRLSGAAGEAQFTTSGTGAFADEASTPITVNNGEFQLDNVNVTAPGASVDVTVKEGTTVDLQAAFPAQFSTTGESVYNVSSDVDPLVAGYQEQVNLTVTNASGGQVTGTELNNLLDNDNAGAGNSDTITQDGNDVSDASSDELSSGDTVDLDNDGTDDTIQVDITPQSTSQVNVTLDNGDGTETGSGAIDVVEPEVETNVENNVLTERLNQSVDVTVIDPRDGSRLASTDETADIRFTVRNGTVEVDDLDSALDATPDDDKTGNPSADQYEFSDDGDQFSATDVANSNLSIAALPYDPDNEQFKLEIEVDSDTGNFYGSTNLTVEPPQVTASPSSIELGSQQTLEVTAEDANGNALGNRNVRLDGAVSTITGSTDASGFVAVTVNPSATGTINVHTASDSDVETSGGGTSPAALSASGSVEDTVNVTTEQSEFDVSVSPQTVTANQSSTVTVTATNNASGDAVEGASVSLSGAGVNTSAQTDANGEANLSVNASSAGTIDVTVNDAGFTQATATITVEEATGPAASVTFDDKTVENGTEEVTVESADYTLADGTAGDYVVVAHVVNDDGSISSPVGYSSNVTGETSDITVDLNASEAQGDALDTLTENTTLRAMLHETSSDSAFGPSLGLATDDANITVSEDAGSPLEGAAGEFDDDADGTITASELGDAVNAFGQGDLTAAELGEVVNAFGQS